jgi:hypothetical protein
MVFANEVVLMLPRKAVALTLGRASSFLSGSWLEMH